MIAGGNFAAFPLLGLTSGEDRASFAGILEDDPTATDLVVLLADIFAGLRGGVVRAMAENPLLDRLIRDCLTRTLA